MVLISLSGSGWCRSLLDADVDVNVLSGADSLLVLPPVERAV